MESLEGRLPPFFEAIHPWIKLARRKLKERAKPHLYLLTENASHEIETYLIRRWSEVVSFSLFVELRLEKFTFSLEGNNSRERYLDFIRKGPLEGKWRNRFFSEKPTLKEVSSKILEFWVQFVSEILSCTARDLSLLETSFHEGKGLGTIQSLELGSGDAHLNGRTSAILTFTSGKKIVYKPKDLRIAEAFQTFLEEINPTLPHPLRTYRIIPRGEYGWEEFVEQSCCENESQVKNYYEKAGMLLCLLDLFDGSDFHLENVIAAGDCPVLIDLETLIHPRFNTFEGTLLNSSTYIVGLIPFDPKNHLHGLNNGIYSSITKRWDQLNTDEMCVKRKKIHEVFNNGVFLKDQLVQAHDFTHSILLGFNRMYQWIEKNGRDPILQFLSKTKDYPIRAVLRSTSVYIRVLKKLCNSEIPFELKLVRKIAELFESELPVDKRFKKLIRIEEEKALLQGDIPFFSSRPDSRDLFIGNTPIAIGCLNKSPLERIFDRLQKRGAEDQNLQNKIIRQSFLVQNPSPTLEMKSVAYSSDPLTLYHARLGFEHLGCSDDPALIQNLTARGIARQIGEMLINHSSWNEGYQWVFLNREVHNNKLQYRFQFSKENLYEGSVGIGLYFAALSSFTGELKWKEGANHTLRHLKRELKEGKERELIERLGIGGMSGIGGVIYGLYSIGKLLQDDSLFDDANTLIDALRQTDIKRDRKYDLMSGSAGLLLALLSTPHPKSLELATACGEHLIRNGKEKKGGTLSWTKAGLGCSHGAAGIAYALLKLYEKTQKPSFQIGAQKAVLYERAFYSKEHQNWPRFDTKKESYGLSWCSGAPGIGLCRQASLPLDEDPLYKQEIAMAFETTQKNLHENDCSLCCGLSGQFELIRAVSKSEAEKKIPLIIQKIGMELSIMDTDLLIPGFMKGVSGMGYTLLRILDTEKKFPQALLLE